MGGIIGILLNNSSVIGCSFTGKVSGNSAYGYVGGIAGAIDPRNSIAACYSSGTILANDGIAGGIVGSMKGSSLTGCYSTAQVTAQHADQCGDIVGYIEYQATITACCHSVTDKSIGQNLDNNGSTINIIHIDNTNNMWESAMNAMNEALTNNSYKWQWKVNNGEDKSTFPLIVEETE